MGAIDMSLPSQGALDKYEKAFSVVMLPFVYKSYQHAWKVLDGPFMDWVAPKLENQGLVFLSNWEWGFRNVTNNKRPVNSSGRHEGPQDAHPAGDPAAGRHGGLRRGGDQDRL
jgi:TRAP-type C4-dicarboxylate transport system substrate-binding protein